ncbi:MAG: glycosyltransferase family 4 protein [Chloroflexi bacterium]|nr:glycosyltransferase family 4 protein [Chloroflexota bacterium]
MTPGLRLCFVLSELRLSGGVQVVLEYAGRLAARGHRVSIVSSVDPDDPATLTPPAGVHLIAVPQRLRRRSLRANLGLAVALARHVPPADFVFATHTPTVPSVLVASRLLRRGRPVWLCQDYREMFADRPVERLIFRLAPVAFDAAFCISLATALTSWRGAQRRILVVGEGVSGLDELLDTRAGQRDTTTVLYVGDDRPRKGLADLLQAMTPVRSVVPAATLVVATKQLGLEVGLPGAHVICLPDRGELARLYATCAVFVSASWAEGFCLPPLEAMASGAPVAVTDSGGVREYTIDGENCLLVPPHDPARLADAIVRLLGDRALAERLGRAGWATASRFRWEPAVERFEAALRQLSPPRVGTGSARIRG